MKVCGRARDLRGGRARGHHVRGGAVSAGIPARQAGRPHAAGFRGAFNAASAFRMERLLIGGLSTQEFRPRIGVLKEIYRCTKRILFPHDGQGPIAVGVDLAETELDFRAMRLPESLQAALDER